MSHVLPRRRAMGTFMLLPVTYTITCPIISWSPGIILSFPPERNMKNQSINVFFLNKA